jgi:Sortase domain
VRARVGSGRGATAAVGLYGAWLGAAGVLAAVGFGDGTQPASAAPARALTTAPVLTPEHASLPGGGAGRKAPAPTASVGRELQEPAVFVPTTLVLPDGTSAPVVPVGLHPDGSLVVPDDVRSVGWWTGGSRAGEPYGSVVVAGHVDSATRGIGVFAQLKRLVPGQVVHLAAGAQIARYRIASATQVPQARLAEDAGIFRVDGEPQLVLVTCGGAFDPARHRYQDNLVVIATPL